MRLIQAIFASQWGQTRSVPRQCRRVAPYFRQASRRALIFADALHHCRLDIDIASPRDDAATMVERFRAGGWAWVARGGRRTRSMGDMMPASRARQEAPHAAGVILAYATEKRPACKAISRPPAAVEEQGVRYFKTRLRYCDDAARRLMMMIDKKRWADDYEGLKRICLR